MKTGNLFKTNRLRRKTPIPIYQWRAKSEIGTSEYQIFLFFPMPLWRNDASQFDNGG